MTKLTHRQMTVLSGAAQREDGAVILPNAMKPASLAKPFADADCARPRPRSANKIQNADLAA